MNIKHISLAISAIAVLLVGCTKAPADESVNNGLPELHNLLTDLELASVNSTETKAVIDGTTFPQAGHIGLFLFNDETAMELYGTTGYANVDYSYNQTKGKWTASPSIKVGSTPGYLFGYYPYSGEVTSIKAIPVASSLNGDDVMYATPVTDVTDANAAQTSITMNHALARVSITVKNNGYTGNAKLSKIKFSGAKIAPEGTLNALDGKITATNSDVTLDVPTANQTITAAGTTYECLLVPSDEISGKQTINLTLTIDGEDKTAQLSGDNGVIIAQNTKSNITINLSNSGISVQTVSVEDWNVVEVGGHKVTVKVADDVPAGDIMYAPYVDGNNVIIKASSFQGKWLACNVGGSTQCERTISNDKFIFTISNISSNIDAVLSYAPPVTLTVSSDSNGKVWIGNDESKASGLFEIGQQVEIHAAANDNFRLFKWNDNNREISRTITLGETGATYSASFISADLIPGLFTVNSDRKQVFFSKGNLWYGPLSPDAVSTWNTEDNQYATPSSDKRDENHISHFCWCANAENSLAMIFNSDWTGEGVEFFANHPESFVVNEKVGWGVLTGGEDGEWEHLLNGRTTVAGTAPNINGTADARYLKCCVNGVNGLMIFPDIFVWPYDVDSPNSQLLNNKEISWQNVHSYSAAQFSKLEDLGAVFLPAAGERFHREGGGSLVYNIISDFNDCGCYWSSSSSSGLWADYLEVNFYNIAPIGTESRDYAFSVRLVKENQSEPSAE